MSNDSFDSLYKDDPEKRKIGILVAVMLISLITTPLFLMFMKKRDQKDSELLQSLVYRYFTDSSLSVLESNNNNSDFQIKGEVAVIYSNIIHSVSDYKKLPSSLRDLNIMPSIKVTREINGKVPRSIEYMIVIDDKLKDSIRYTSANRSVNKSLNRHTYYAYFINVDKFTTENVECFMSKALPDTILIDEDDSIVNGEDFEKFPVDELLKYVNKHKV